MQMLWPLLMVVLANIFYHLLAKNIPVQLNAFLSLAVTYLAAGAVSLVCWVASAGADPARLGRQLGQVSWVSAVMGLAVVGLELGFILAYRAGWQISVASLVSNAAVAAALALVGLLVYGEHLTALQACGLLLCAGGLFLVVRGGRAA